MVSETALPPVTGVPPVTDLPPMTDAPPMTMTSATEMQPSPTVSSTEAPASPTATDSQGPTMPTHPVAPGCPQEMDPCNPQTVQGSCSGTYLAWCTSKKHWRLQACADGLICKMWTGAPRCDYPSIVDPPVTCKGLPGASKAKVAPTATMVSEEEAEDDEDDKVTVNKNKSSADAATICMCPEDSGFPATAVKETAVLPCEAPKSGLRARRCYHNKGDNSCSWGVIRPHCL